MTLATEFFARLKHPQGGKFLPRFGIARGADAYYELALRGPVPGAVWYEQEGGARLVPAMCYPDGHVELHQQTFDEERAYASSDSWPPMPEGLTELYDEIKDYGPVTAYLEPLARVLHKLADQEPQRGAVEAILGDVSQHLRLAMGKLLRALEEGWRP